MKTTAETFHEEADKWERETSHLSSPTQIMSHPSYQAVLNLALGNKMEVISLMLKDMKKNRRHWFAALSQLTNENPIKPEDAGRVDRMIQSWMSWAERKGYIC